MVNHRAAANIERKLLLAEQYPLLAEQLNEARADLRTLIRSGRWLVWHAHVEITSEGAVWTFRRDYGAAALSWMPIAVSEDEDFQQAINRARLPEDGEQCHERCWAALLGGLPGYTQQFRVRLRTGEIRWLSEIVHVESITTTAWNLTGIGIDITENKRNEEELDRVRREVMIQNAELQNLQTELEAQNDELASANARLEGLATIDGLTGLKNHRTFQETLEYEWRGAQRHDAPLSLIFLDVDRFKHYNDTFGHPAGDDVLKDVGYILRECARETDCVARYGGEEFVVIAPRTDEDGAMALAERFRERIADTTFAHREVTASFGVATAHGFAGEMQMLISQADRALYAAKTQGRNAVVHAGGMK